MKRTFGIFILSIMSCMVIGGCSSLEKDVKTRIEQHYIGKQFNDVVVPVNGKAVVRKVIDDKSSDYVIAYGYCDAYENDVTAKEGKIRRPMKVYFRAKFLKLKPSGMIEDKFSQIIVDFPEDSNVVQVFWNNEEEVFMKFAYGGSK